MVLFRKHHPPLHRSGQTSLYLERDIDKRLFVSVHDWLASAEKSGWISLKSAPGRGNTSLFSQFESTVEPDVHFFGNTRRLYVSGPDRDPSRPPSELDPFSAALHALYSQAFASRWSRWRRSLSNAGAWPISRLVLTWLIGVAVFTLLIALLQYSSSGTAAGSVRWWRNFFSVYFQRHLEDLPVWLVLSVVSSSLWSWLLSRGKLGLPGPAPVPATQADRARFRDLYSEVPNILHDLCRDRSALILFIDDAYAQSDELKHFLKDLHSPLPSFDRLRQFRHNHRVLIVTLDIESSTGALGNIKPVPLPVPSFTLLELRDIADGLSIDVAGHNAMRLEQARVNINRLFEDEDLALEREVARDFTALGAEADVELGAAEILAYCALSGWSYISRSQIDKWMNRSSSEAVASHYELFRLEEPARRSDTVRAIRTSIFMRPDGLTYYFNERALRQLRKVLAEQHPLLLARAHYFWFRDSSRGARRQGIRVEQLGATAKAWRTELKQAAWHAAELGRPADNPLQVLRDRDLPQAKLIEHSRDGAAVLLEAADSYAQEGALVEARNVVLDALDWIEALDPEDVSLFSNAAAFALWQFYFSSADKNARKVIEQTNRENPSLSDNASWALSRGFEEFLLGRPVPAPSPETELAGARAKNFYAYVNTQISIRKQFGLDLPENSLGYIPSPEPDCCVTRYEFYLLEAAADSAARAKEPAGIAEAFEKWRRRLDDTMPTDGSLELDGLHALSEAGYFAKLLELRTGALVSMDRIAADVSQPDLFERALSLYQRAAQIGDLLDLYPLRAEALFCEGLLWKTFGETYAAKNQTAGWANWERIWELCLKIESDAGWLLFSPRIHWERWKCFQEKDRPTAIQDLYNFYRCAKAAGLPLKWVLWSQGWLRNYLVNFGDDGKHALIYAELFETWARDFAALPAAVEYREFPDSLVSEQVSAFVFASQGFRLAGQFPKAAAVIEEAESLIAASETEGQVAELQIRIKMQKAWLASSSEDKPTYARLISEIWAALAPDHVDATSILNSLLLIEHDQGLLTALWSANENPWVDPVNEKFNLPQTWFSEPRKCPLPTRLDFRLHQLAHFVSEEPYPDDQTLQAAAHGNWFGQKMFDVVVRALASQGLQQPIHPYSKALLIRLLKAVAAFHREIEPNHRKELNTLSALRSYEPENAAHRREYERVEREMQSLQARDKEHEYAWMDAVQNWFDRMSTYEDLALRDKTLSSASSPAFVEAMRNREQSVSAAFSKFTAGQFAECLQIVLELVPATKFDWVQKEDLLLLDLGIRSATRTGADGQRHMPSLKRQLRELGTQYVNQKRQSIGEDESQRLAFELLDHLRELSYSVGPADKNQTATA